MPEPAMGRIPSEGELTRRIAAFRENPGSQSLNDVINSLLHTVLLAPPALQGWGSGPTTDAQGRIKRPEYSKKDVPMVSNPKGEKYYVAFSNQQTLNEGLKHLPGRGKVCLCLRFDDYVALLKENGQAAGLIIDPFTAVPFRLVREMMDDIVAQRDTAQAVVLGTPRPGEEITLAEPTVCPDAMLDALCEILARDSHITAACLQLMLRKDGPSCYLLILDGTTSKELLIALVAAAKPHLQSQAKKLPLAVTPSSSPLGHQGMEDAEPFYRRGEGRLHPYAEESAEES